MSEIVVRTLRREDPPILVAAFQKIGWHKTVAQYIRYLGEQALGDRAVYIGEIDQEFAGYVTVLWKSNYPSFRENSIPEISDLNVLPQYQRRGIGTKLVDEAERGISICSPVAGIGVGLHPGYNAAQRMYVLRGYIPDGKGVTYANRYVREGERVPFDDNLVLYFTKSLLRSGA
jgi:GNAT superfamily N-acetyltransferase